MSIKLLKEGPKFKVQRKVYIHRYDDNDTTFLFEASEQDGKNYILSYDRFGTCKKQDRSAYGLFYGKTVGMKRLWHFKWADTGQEVQFPGDLLSSQLEVSKQYLKEKK